MTLYYCCLCIGRDGEKRNPPFTLDTSKGMKAPLDHLEQTHFINRKTGEPLPRGNIGQRLLNQATTSGVVNATRDWIWAGKFELFKLLLLRIRWIVYLQIAVSIVDNPYFIAFLRFLNLPIAKMIKGRKIVYSSWRLTD